MHVQNAPVVRTINSEIDNFIGFAYRISPTLMTRTALNFESSSSSPAPANDAGEALDWEEFEVSESDLAQTHPSWAELVELDVCILPAAFPTWVPPSDGKVGWRAQVTAKRGSEK